MNLNELRKEVDLVDRRIVSMILQRSELVRGIGVMKKRAGISIRDTERENEVLHNVISGLDDPAEIDSIRRIFDAILAESRALQSSVNPQSSQQDSKII